MSAEGFGYAPRFPTEFAAMPDTALLGVVADRLDAQPPADDAADLVLAAFQGDEAVEAVLDGQPGAVRQSAAAAKSGASAGAAYLTSIEVEGFRGIGPAATLQVD